MTNELTSLLTTFEQWALFCEDLKGLNEAQWASSLEPGKWSIKDIVAHMMRWDKYFYDTAIAKIAAGEGLTLQHLKYDDFNKEAVDYAANVSTDELIQQAIDIRMKIIHEISVMPEEVIARKYTDADGNEFNIPQYLQDFIWHDRHHMVPLQQHLQAS
ncbi:DinB family protein [Paenibacillus sp. CAA11]|uniref:DinB family protein n=1 Tax=Paenibacillus sp. CAA11 TaxID=1532905 RepID=UPI000D34C5E8|nr:DinB family protein [Paenibacillus sp. CAA11]AWB44757.1 DinB family protein [Paenibacillus sp. CAA11]